MIMSIATHCETSVLAMSLGDWHRFFVSRKGGRGGG